MIGPTQASIASRPHRVLLQTPTEPVPDGDGGYTAGVVPLTPPALFVRIAAASAADLERQAAGTLITTATHLVSAPYHAQIDTHTQLVYGTRLFQVDAVRDPEERHVELTLICRELKP